MSSFSSKTLLTITGSRLGFFDLCSGSSYQLTRNTNDGGKKTYLNYILGMHISKSKLWRNSIGQMIAVLQQIVRKRSHGN